METAVLRVQTCWYADHFNSWRMLSNCWNCCPERHHFFTIIQHFISFFFWQGWRRRCCSDRKSWPALTLLSFIDSAAVGKKSRNYSDLRSALLAFTILMWLETSLGRTSDPTVFFRGCATLLFRADEPAADGRKTVMLLNVRVGAAVWRGGGDSWHINRNIHIRMQNSDPDTARRHLDTRYWCA